jgi:hypothetical protein
MGGEKMRWRTATRAAVAVAAVAFLLAAASCEESPTSGPAPAAWVPMAVVPGDYSAQAIASEYLKGVLAAGSYYDENYVGHGVVLAYRSGAFDVEFMSPNDAGEVILYDMDPTGRYAAGTYKTSEPRTKRTPYMVAFDQSHAVWYEVPLEPVEGESITQVIRSRRAGWLLIGATGPRGGNLYKYKGEGAAERQEGLPVLASVAASPNEDTVFGVDCITYGRYNAVMSFDGGASWRIEEIPAIAPGFDIMYLDAGCAAAGDLYFYVEFERRGAGILRRSGSATDGEYEVVFYTPVGNFTAVAAADDGRMMAVGAHTSVIFDGENWQAEQLPYPLNLRRVIAAPGGGFLALGYNEAVWQREILYHP